jgi:hypothetical protein
MPHIGTITYRLAGNLFDNKYFINSTSEADAISSLVSIQEATAVFQTPDVEYVSAQVTDLESPYSTASVLLTVLNGQATGEPTMPAITFLEFVFHTIGQRGTTTHKIRGCAANDVTDLGVFNAHSGGAGDPDSSTPTAGGTAYTSYLGAVVENSTDRNLRALSASSRVSVGSKRATRRL